MEEFIIIIKDSYMRNGIIIILLIIKNFKFFIYLIFLVKFSCFIVYFNGSFMFF